MNVPVNEWYKERKVQGLFVPGNESSRQQTVQFMDHSFPRTIPPWERIVLETNSLEN